MSYHQSRRRALTAFGCGCFLLGAGVPAPSSAQQTTPPLPTFRIALIIANGAYSRLPPLPGAARDAETLRVALAGARFAVEPIVANTKLTDLTDAVAKFTEKYRRLEGNAVAVVYYAGHGVVDRGQGQAFVVPVDYDPSSGQRLSSQSLSMAKLREMIVAAQASTAMPSARKDALLIFDACRTDVVVPARTSLDQLGARIEALRGDAQSRNVWVPVYRRQVALTEVGATIRPSVTVAYSAEPGNVASDDGTFATELSRAISQEGATSYSALTQTQQSVAAKIAQVPNIELGSIEAFVFTPTRQQLMNSVGEVLSKTNWDDERQRLAALARLDELLPDATALSRASAILGDLACLPLASAARAYFVARGVSCK